jgi:TrmH family RNA methyltransferase
MAYIQDNKSAPLKPLKWYKELSTIKGRCEAGAFLVEGDRAIRQVITAHPEAIIEIIAANEPPSHLLRYPIRLVTQSQFNAVASAATPQGVMAVVKAPQDIYTGNLPREMGNKLLLLEDVQDPGNTGTLIRTAAAFGFSGIIMTDKCADPLSPKCVQSTAGSILSLWLRRSKSYLQMVQHLKENGYFLAAAALEGNEDTTIFSKKDQIILALGNEASGLSQDLLALADYQLRLPIARDKAESLNVASCGAICMYLTVIKAK